MEWVEASKTVVCCVCCVCRICRICRIHSIHSIYSIYSICRICSAWWSLGVWLAEGGGLGTDGREAGGSALPCSSRDPGRPVANESSPKHFLLRPPDLNALDELDAGTHSIHSTQHTSVRLAICSATRQGKAGGRGWSIAPWHQAPSPPCTLNDDERPTPALGPKITFFRWPALSIRCTTSMSAATCSLFFERGVEHSASFTRILCSTKNKYIQNMTASSTATCHVRRFRRCQLRLVPSAINCLLV